MEADVMKPTPLFLSAAVAGSVIALGTIDLAKSAPVSTHASAIKEAAPSDVIDVRRRSRHYYGYDMRRYYPYNIYRYSRYGYGPGGCPLWRTHHHRNSAIIYRCP
jgi:hypothetical protein